MLVERSLSIFWKEVLVWKVLFVFSVDADVLRTPDIFLTCSSLFYTGAGDNCDAGYVLLLLVRWK
jgi:hypothetical protein